MQSIKVSMTREKETARTWRFKADEVSASIVYLYVRKSAFVGGAVPKKIHLTIEADNASA